MSVRVEPRLEHPSEVTSIASGPALHLEDRDVIEIQQYGNVQNSFDFLQDSDSSRATSRSDGSGLTSYTDAPSDAAEAETMSLDHDTHSIDLLRQHLMSPGSSSSHGLVPVTPIKPQGLPLSPHSQLAFDFGPDAMSPLGSHDGEAASSSFMPSPQVARRRGVRPGPLPPPLPIAQPPEIPHANAAEQELVPPSPLQRTAAQRLRPRVPSGPPPFDAGPYQIHGLRHPPSQSQSQSQSQDQSQIQVQNQNQNQNQKESQSQSQSQNQNPVHGNENGRIGSQERTTRHHALRLAFGQPRQVSDTRSLHSHGSHVSDDGHIEPARQVRQHALSLIKRSGPAMGAGGQYLAGQPRLPIFPLVEPRRAHDLVLEKRDPWGRRLAPPHVAWILLLACAAFPPLWLLLSAGYFDILFGVIPRAVKLTATALALGTLAAVIALVTVFGVLKT